MIGFPQTTDIGVVADWVELEVLSTNKSLSKSKLFRLWGNAGNPTEENVDSVLLELRDRITLYGDPAPFQISGNTIAPGIKWVDHPELVMCLIFSLVGVRKKTGETDGTKLFEQVTQEAVKSYLGGQAEVIGFPNKENLATQIGDLSNKMFEEIGHKTPVPTDKDKGVDVIAWKPHGDERQNQIVILLQSAAGIHYGTKKAISLPAWYGFMHWSAKPLKGIAIPIIVLKKELDDLGYDYHLVFDRIRLFRHFSTDIPKKLRVQVRSWCRKRLKELATTRIPNRKPIKRGKGKGKTAKKAPAKKPITKKKAVKRAAGKAVRKAPAKKKKK